MSQKCNFANKRNSLRMLLVLFITVLVVAACSSAASTTPPQQQVPAEEVITEQDAMSNQAMTGKEETSNEAMRDDEMMAGEEKMSDEAMADEAMAEGEAMAGEEKMSDETMAEGEAMADEMMAEGEAMAGEEKMSDEAMTEGETMEQPNWFGVELTNVNTGQTFKIADFQDKVVLVETMAVWCSNCLRQQREVQTLHDLLGDQPNLVSVALDIDSNETNDILKAHADKNNFNWVYAVTPAEVAREISQLYGGQFLNPPATPMLIIDQHGQVHPLPFGHKTVQSLQEALAPFLNEIEG